MISVSMRERVEPSMALELNAGYCDTKSPPAAFGAAGGLSCVGCFSLGAFPYRYAVSVGIW